MFTVALATTHTSKQQYGFYFGLNYKKQYVLTTKEEKHSDLNCTLVKGRFSFYLHTGANKFYFKSSLKKINSMKMSSTTDRSVGTSTALDNTHLQEKLSDAQLKFEKACQQIVLLDQKIKDLEVRYKRAVKNKKNSFRYNLRLRLSVVTGVKMMYHHYASTKAEELTRLHRLRPTTSSTSATASSSGMPSREQS